MYEVTAPNGEGMYEACAEFVPPHYDNVTCILPYGDSVFTASKDTVSFIIVRNKFLPLFALYFWFVLLSYNKCFPEHYEVFSSRSETRSS